MPKEKIKRSKKRAQEVVDKITIIFGLVEALPNEDIEYLEDTKKIIQAEVSQHQAVGGILTPLHKSDAKIGLGEQAIARIDGLIKIRNAMAKTNEVRDKFQKDEMDTKAIEQSFGL